MKNPPLLFQAKVSEFEAAREALTAFRNKNSKLIDQHEMLRNAYNSALKETKAEFKKNVDDIGDRFGEFRITKRIDINAELLLKLMPNADACVKIEYRIDREEYDKLVKAGIIPQEIVEKIESVGSISVYGPKEA